LALADLYELVPLYLQLAHEHDKRARQQERDRFLLLAADAAFMAGRPGEADRIRQNLLAKNPHHLLRPFANMAEAIRSPDISAYLDQLRRSYPKDKVSQMLRELRDEMVVTLHDDGPPQRPSEDEFDLPLEPETKLKRESPPRGNPSPDGGPSPSSAKPAGPGTFAVKEDLNEWFKKPAPPLYTPPRPDQPGGPTERASESDAPPAGAWVALAAGVLLLAGAAALLGYVFLMPILGH